jgi:hypothetical protein
MRFPNACKRPITLAGLAAVALTLVVPARAGAAPDYDRQRLLAGHFLRRVAFGPTPADLDEVLRIGTTAYLEKQLDPGSIDDHDIDFAPQGRRGYFWYLRILYSKRQLQERMTLLWHEHFATALNKVQNVNYMSAQEEIFRTNALGSFRQLLIDVSKDPAMLIFLDNVNNNGRARDARGNPIPPNENYARELMQLFAIGTEKLNMDGTPILGTDGRPIPAYTEQDVKDVARALTGWAIQGNGSSTRPGRGVFKKALHDRGDKTVFGVRIAGRKGPAGAQEVDDVVNLLMQHPSMAPFIAKELIMKLATETPTPGYVERVATVFKQTSGDIKATVRAIFTDAEFTSDAVVRTQLKTPIEIFASATRALAPDTFLSPGMDYRFYEFTRRSKHLVYHPPSVFSFYRPGAKASLVTTGLAIVRDTAFDELLLSDRLFGVSLVEVHQLIRDNGLDTPEKVVDFFADRLLTAPLQPEVRQEILDYMGGFVSDDRARSAVWLILCSPDFQVN